MTTHESATAADWLHWDLVLGLGGNLLPVAPSGSPAPYSKLKSVGKVPSAYDGEGFVYGITGWQKREIKQDEVKQWAADRRLSMCVRTGTLSGVYVLDVDSTDADRSIEIEQLIEKYVGELPRRYRSNSSKFLLAFRMAGEHRKRFFRLTLRDTQRIEFLGHGQQFVAAGLHESGVKYEWTGGAPDELPTLDVAEFEALWAALVERFAVEAPRKSPTETIGTGEALTKIDSITLAQLREALDHTPLIEAAADNDTWSEIGYALLSLGDVGRELFITFSAKAPNYEENAPHDWWAAHETQTPRSDYRHIFTMARGFGWKPPAATPDMFKTVTINTPDEEPEYQPDDELPCDKVPPAQHLCTDQANANRLHASFGDKLISIGGAFYAWTGTHWRRDESEAARCGARLSAIVKAEAAAARERFEALRDGLEEQPDPKVFDKRTKEHNAFSETEGADQLFQAYEKMKALERWSTMCEMASTQNAAIGLLRKMLNVEGARLDTHNHLFNCASGTIDLRTGKLWPHNPRDLITHCVRIEYKPDAQCPRFESFLVEILDEPAAEFLQQWFGYCATGETIEHKVLLHIGDGSNGKSTLFDVIKDVFGTYAKSAAPNLLTGKGAERHPTEVADLLGVRLAFAHESDEGAALREGFLKQATGGDLISARFLFKDFFTFKPTFKLQLLTNHKPIVRGTDYGIWRRLYLIQYGVQYGTPEEVERGSAHKVGDPHLAEKLNAEREGILAWVVRGATKWYAKGLRPPIGVIHASEQYKQEQNRVAKFLDERCLKDPEAWAPWSGPFGALYPAYTMWCKECGFIALSKSRFEDEIVKAGGTSVTRAEVRRKVDGVWRTMKGCKGIKVNVDGDGGGFKSTGNEDLL